MGLQNAERRKNELETSSASLNALKRQRHHDN